MKQSLSLIRAGRRIAAPGFERDIHAEWPPAQVKTAEYRDFDRMGLFSVSTDYVDISIAYKTSAVFSQMRALCRTTTEA
jgi:hypothetical protein